jgi:hypothetical protein
MLDAATRARRGARSALTAALLLALAGCGPSTGDAPPGPTPAPTGSGAPTPVPTFAAPSEIAPMVLAPAGIRATSVSPREWITITVPGTFDDETVLALPPDAGPDAGPLPVPGCPLFDRPAGCGARGFIDTVGNSDWATGFAETDITSVPAYFPAAFGPGGEVSILDCCDTQSAVSQLVPVPGGRFLGVKPDPADDVRRGVLVRDGGEYEFLPSGAFADGTTPRAADASFTIVGDAGAVRTPVAWRPVGDAYELVVLTIPDDDVAGSAVAIEDGRIAGYSGRDLSLRAVVWAAPDVDATPVPLPLLEATISCRPTALSAGRVAGNCVDEPRREHALLWSSDAPGTSWHVSALLLPVAGDTAAHVSGLAGDLAVGWSIAGDGTERAVAWRVP